MYSNRWDCKVAKIEDPNHNGKVSVSKVEGLKQNSHMAL